MHRLRAEYRGRIDVRSLNPHRLQDKELIGPFGAFTPTFVFVRADGQIATTFVGDVDEARLRRELELLLKDAAEG